MIVKYLTYHVYLKTKAAPPTTAATTMQASTTTKTVVKWTVLYKLNWLLQLTQLVTKKQ